MRKLSIVIATSVLCIFKYQEVKSTGQIILGINRYVTSQRQFTDERLHYVLVPYLLELAQTPPPPTEENDGRI